MKKFKLLTASARSAGNRLAFRGGLLFPDDHRALPAHYTEYICLRPTHLPYEIRHQRDEALLHH